MAFHYTRKKDEATEKDVPASEFLHRMLDSKRIPDAKKKIDKIELPK